jgi:hypothetical protein
MGTKRTKQQDFQTTFMKVDLVLNPIHGIKKLYAKIRCVHDVNARRLYYKNLTKNNNNHDKDMYQKLVLNILKVMWDSTSIYIH